MIGIHLTKYTEASINIINHQAAHFPLFFFRQVNGNCSYAKYILAQLHDQLRISRPVHPIYLIYIFSRPKVYGSFEALYARVSIDVDMQTSVRASI